MDQDVMDQNRDGRPDRAYVDLDENGSAGCGAMVCYDRMWDLCDVQPLDGFEISDFDHDEIPDGQLGTTTTIAPGPVPPGPAGMPDSGCRTYAWTLPDNMGGITVS
jgi:hypothetical protein